MRNGQTTRSSRAVPGESWTKNAMVIFDPASWRPVEIYKMHERDGLSRVSCASMGYEDIRIFRTGQGGLQGIAASLHLWRGDRAPNRLAEQVLLSFDADYNVVRAHPIRGSSWGKSPQKNWAPFDDCLEPRFLFSIGGGTLFDAHGPLPFGEAPEMLVRPSLCPPAPLAEPSAHARRRARRRATNISRSRDDVASWQDVDDHGLGLSPDPLMFEDLRGGTQLVRVGTEGWLGIGHKMKLVNRKKLYWHVWYLVDARGKMTAASPPMKLAPNGIEFAAGMGIEGDRVVVSFGVDDMACKIGETRLAAVLGTLQKLGG